MPSAPRDARRGIPLIITDHNSAIHARRKRGASAGNSSNANPYAAAPLAKSDIQAEADRDHHGQDRSQDAGSGVHGPSPFHAVASALLAGSPNSADRQFEFVTVCDRAQARGEGHPHRQAQRAQHDRTYSKFRWQNGKSDQSGQEARENHRCQGRWQRSTRQEGSSRERCSITIAARAGCPRRSTRAEER